MELFVRRRLVVCRSLMHAVLLVDQPSDPSGDVFVHLSRADCEPSSVDTMGNDAI
ncbi:MAG: hypothetical protein ACRD0Q_03645 [Acidimicrobiales bacterium]